jgi:mono/diheme cytochrome c family protein
MTDNQQKSDRSPSVSNTSWLFAWASTAFLIGIILASLVLPSDEFLRDTSADALVVEAGKTIYEGEGCASCHSMMVRRGDRGLGTSATFESMAMTDVWPGSSRIGPDLQNLNGHYPIMLLSTRLTEPQTLQPGTVMPSYGHLGETSRDALIAFLSRPVLATGGWSEIRALNGIEPSIPDAVLDSLRDSFDPETGMFISPVQDTPEFLITGSGIYKSRCAACHGLQGRGDGPVSWQPGADGDGHSSLIPPADFTSSVTDYSDIMLYLRISDGVPGTEMPAWSDTMTEYGIWHLVGYVRSLARYRFPLDEIEVEPALPLWEDIPLEIDPEDPLFDEWISNMTDSGMNSNSINADEISVDIASEEDGGSMSVGDETDDTNESAENSTTGEVSP